MIVIDTRDRRPLHQQVTEKLQALILAGALPAGSRLPSVREMAVTLAINPNTVQRAYQELERRGLIDPVKGRGAYVADGSTIARQKRREALSGLAAALEVCRASGVPGEEVLRAVRAFAEEEGNEHD